MISPDVQGACSNPSEERPKARFDQTQGGHEKIRPTNYGLPLSGPTAYLSDICKGIFYDDECVKCFSVEQQNLFLRATFNKLFELGAFHVVRTHFYMLSKPPLPPLFTCNTELKCIRGLIPPPPSPPRLCVRN